MSYYVKTPANKANIQSAKRLSISTYLDRAGSLAAYIACIAMVILRSSGFWGLSTPSWRIMLRFEFFGASDRFGPGTMLNNLTRN